MQHRVCRFAALCLLVVASAAVMHAAATGGFIESATSTATRAPLSAADIAAFLPERGRFVFPAPYSTTAARISTSADCAGSDCVNPVGYSYWRNINNHAGSDTMLIFLGLARERGGAGPTLFSYNKVTGDTRNAGALFGAASRFSWATGEGWYFSATRPTTLYMNDGSSMLRYDVSARTFETVFDARIALGRNDVYIWQMHSSNDDRFHSATVKDNATYQSLGCVAYIEDQLRATFYPAIGEFDECQIDKSGRWLVIKENVDGRYGEDNRIVDLQTGMEQLLLDEDGAAGHSDVGYGYMVAEDNWAAQPGAARVWTFGTALTPGPGQGTLVYHMTQWTSGLGHVAHANARAGVPLNQQIACNSNVNRLAAPRVNEIVCYRLDGSLNALVVAPNMTDLNAAGGGADDYAKLPKGNLDVTGEYFIWTSNAGSGRLDAFLVHVPLAKLGGTTGEPVEPEPQPGVTWASLANVTATGNALQKTSGCDCCPDGYAISEAQISGNGSLTWAATEAATLRLVGLSPATTVTTQLPFAIRLQNGVAEIREQGVYKVDTTFNAGDAFGILVENGAVRYTKNGAAFYTSASSPTTVAMRAHFVFYGMNGSVGNIAITAAGASSPPPASTEPPPPPPLFLTARGYKVKGVQKADLTWSGATTATVDVHRNGVVVSTTSNDGLHTDNIDAKGGGSYRYKVCETDTTRCSAEAVVTF